MNASRLCEWIITSLKPKQCDKTYREGKNPACSQESPMHLDRLRFNCHNTKNYLHVPLEQCIFIQHVIITGLSTFGHYQPETLKKKDPSRREMLHNKSERATSQISALQAKANQCCAAACTSLYTDDSLVDNRISEEINARVVSKNANRIFDMFLGSFNTLNAYWRNNELTAAATQLCNLLPWEKKQGEGGWVVPVSGNFNMALRKRVGGETAAVALRTYSVTYPAFICLQRWLRCLQQEGEKYPWRREETSTTKDVHVSCFFILKRSASASAKACRSNDGVN